MLPECVYVWFVVRSVYVRVGDGGHHSGYSDEHCLSMVILEYCLYGLEKHCGYCVAYITRFSPNI